MEITEILSQRILLLDGSMGVELRKLAPDESAVRGRRFMTHRRSLVSNLDILNLSRPELVASVYDAYLEAGADIIETNTFNSNLLSQREYATDSLVRELNLAGVKLAIKKAKYYTSITPDKPRFVAGSMGPTALSASLPSEAAAPWMRSVDFDTLAEAYTEQAAALIEGGVDILLIETAFDLLNAKAALYGVSCAMESAGRRLPLFVSITISDRSGRVLSGHTPEAFLAAIAHYTPAAVGFNCSAGPESLAPALRRLSAASPFPIIFYPNAGLPDRQGNYSLNPQKFVDAVKPLLDDKQINIIGGCCGTTPLHIRRLREYLDAATPSPRSDYQHVKPAWLSGLSEFDDSRGFINVGERCNVAGSRKFLRLVKEGDTVGILEIARKQVAAGAMILDINMDDPMLDAPREMEKFLRLLASDPDTASLPWMIDSSDFKVVETALKNMAGKGIVNSISLKHGEEDFIAKVRLIRRYGAAVVVMLFDEQGQAADYERKIEIARRAVTILTDRCGFDRRDIIIDANILTIATGMAEHDRYALDYLRAVEWIGKNLPGVKTSGGLSNLSFAFRGNNYLRQAMHAVFLYHAVKAGLSMAIMDPGTKVAYADIEPDLLERLEDVILCRRPDAAARLTEVAADYSDKPLAVEVSDVVVNTDVLKRISSSLIAGDAVSLERDLPEAVGRLGTATAVVEGPLMAAMEEVGRRFEAGKMFLPQVVKSAGAMHTAVECLRPLLEQGTISGATAGKFLISTVRGDVHDIGKNISAVVLRCNNFEVIDLGVQVEAEKIVEEALRLRPDFIGLSGLITPSLEEMVVTAKALKSAGVSVPIFVGGAATSELHTALKIAPVYDGVVVRVRDASANPVAAMRWIQDPAGEERRIRESQKRLVEEYYEKEKELKVSEDAADHAGESASLYDKESIIAPSFSGIRTLPQVAIADVRPYINYTYFYKCWQVDPRSAEADKLREDAERLLNELQREGATMRAQVAFYEAYSDGDAIVAGGETIPTLRQHKGDSGMAPVALSDFVAPRGEGDHIGCFLVTIGSLLRERIDEASRSKDSYSLLLLQSLADRLAEATSEWLHRRVRVSLWGYSPDEPLDYEAIRRGKYRGIRPAVGYPSLPDQRLMHKLVKLLAPQDVEVSVTVNGALTPSSSVAGFYLASPRSRYFTIN
ncbi:MAG: methionine synthase [Lepagella sp.]